MWDLEECWSCPSLCYILIQCQSTTIVASLHLWGATWWPNVAWMLAGAEIGIEGRKKSEIWHYVAVKVCWRDLQSRWECSSTCYTPIQCQSTTIVASLHLWGATWWPNVASKSAEIGIWGEKTAIICGCKSMTEGLRNMLNVFLNLLYIHTMPNNHYCSTYMMAYPHLMAKHYLTVGRKSKIEIFPTDLRHETCQHVAVKVWWMDLQSCWECSSICYTPTQCQTTTIAAPTWCHTPACWPNIA